MVNNVFNFLWILVNNDIFFCYKKEIKFFWGYKIYV